MSAKSVPRKQVDHKSEISLDEARLIWDEYKYRHDLIWRHLTRLTIAVVALLTASYSSTLKVDMEISIIASLVAIIFIVFNFTVLNSELRLLENIKVLYRHRQNELYQLHVERNMSSNGLAGGFSRRVRLYLLGLLLLALIATGGQVINRIDVQLFGL